MSGGDQSSMERMERLAREVKESVDRMAASGRSPNQNGNNININAGGIAAWLCATASILSLAACAYMAVMFLDMNRKYDRTQDLLSVIYQQAPWLKPPPEKKN